MIMHILDPLIESGNEGLLTEKGESFFANLSL